MITLSLSSVRIVEPASERNKIGLLVSAGTVDLRIPLEHIKQSAYSISGAIVMSIRSKPEVGPMINPWSKANIVERPLSLRKMRDKRSFIPHERLSEPLTWNDCFATGTPTPKRLPSLRSSKSAIFLFV